MFSEGVVLKAAGLCGITGPLITSAFTLSAILYSPWFTWTENALSDLGVSGTAALLFNTGLITGGLITAAFTLGLREALKRTVLGQAGALLLTVDSFTLTLVGIFPETAGPIHFYISIAFFTLLSLSLLITGASLIQSPSERGLGLLAASAGIVSAAVWATPYRGVAVPEAAAYLAGAAWFITMGLKILPSGRSKPFRGRVEAS